MLDVVTMYLGMYSSGKRTGVLEVPWERWEMGTHMFLMHQILCHDGEMDFHSNIPYVGTQLS